MKKVVLAAIIAAASGVAFAGTMSGQTQGASSGTSNQTAANSTQTKSQMQAHVNQSKSDMNRLDTNKDQRISKEEARSEPDLVGTWDVADVNADGSIDLAEFALFKAEKHIPASQAQQLGSRSSSANKTGNTN